MAIFRKTVLATAMLGASLASTTGAAVADTQEGVANIDGVQTIAPTDVCNNNVPVNVLGVQVPVQDVAGDVPIASPSEDGGNQAGVEKGCGTGVDAENDDG